MQVPDFSSNSKKSQPLVSIIITSYNYGRYLADAVQSVLEQTYANIEIIIVDDGSTDNTKEIASLFSVKYVYQSNQGVSSAKNTGIRYAHGQFFICLDGDDKLFPTFVEKTLRQILEHSTTAFVYVGSVTFDEVRNAENIWMPRRMYTKYSLFAGWHGALGPIMIRKKAFESLTFGFDTELPVHEDMDLCFRFLTAGWKSDLVYEPLHWYRIHDGSLNPITKERKKVAGEFLDKKYKFRKNYRLLFELYKETLGKVESLLRAPFLYLTGVQKKIQIQLKARSYSNSILNKKALKTAEEINFTLDMLIEWHNNERLCEYYREKILTLENSLEI
jgi:glycosyltransferase involved in cell wall biosynthesis